ncbi:MAG: EF2563 family selenium-dependent molybdenum hydroxylase system protein [Anaerolineaceae bacterium]|nr:MAG: EF2563 family selenium-dependent molybdenum hydroxylase system protein [Anaerolineaceae bacterium]
MNELILLRGGGDLASGVALRLHHAGFRVVITELPRPLAVRRSVSFSEAVYDGQTTVEDVTARLVTPDQVESTLSRGEIPVLADPNADILLRFTFYAVIDARLTKSRPQPIPVPVPLHVGLGPGFLAPRDCHAVIETRRGHTLGRVLWQGESASDSGQPEGDPRRVLRSNDNGVLIAHSTIGDHLEAGQLIAEIQSKIENRKSEIHSPFEGVLRGLLRDGMDVTRGLKLGDVDPRDDPVLCRLVSDKALAVGGGVLEAILTARHFQKI